MLSLKKRIALGVVVAAAAGAVAVPAFAMRGGDGGCFDGSRMQQRMEQRQQDLHDQLKLNKEQEKGWKTYSEAVKSALPKRGDFDPKALRDLPAPERAYKMLVRSQERLDAMRKGAEAMKAFYATLTPEQKKTFDQQSFGGFHGGPGKGR